MEIVGWLLVPSELADMQPRFIFLIGSFCLLLLSLMTTSCGYAGSENLYVIDLTDTIRTTGASNRQVYWGIADTTLWEATVAKADTFVPMEDHIKFRSENIWYQARFVNEELRASQPYPGWERRIDTVSFAKSVIRLLDNNRVVVDIPAADVVLGGDSLRIGVIRVVDRAFSWQDFELNHPDYLVLAPYGSEVVPISMDQINLGPIGRQTVFRVGRRHYVLRSVAEDHGSITVEAYDAARGMPLTAEMDAYYKQVPVKDLEGNPTTIKRTNGKELAIYFFHLGYYRGVDVSYIDSLYQSLPLEEQEKLDIAFVSRHSFQDSLSNFVDRENISLPVYQSSEKTCARMNCNPFLPYAMTINERGRIASFFKWRATLENRLKALGGEGQQGASR